MDAQRWQRVEELFEAALEKAPGDRKAFLREACAGDDALYAEIDSLLDEDRQAHSLLDGVAFDAAGLLGDLSLEGQRIGPYLLRRQLGTGGMGAVYLATRADGQFEQEVALKLIKRGMDSDAVLRRFRGERQILARLQHPNIARLLDGGVTEAGQSYFVMEYVDGVPIDAYCDRHRLTIDARLDLFQQVCKAVLYAHANLVVHRDLKPSNILVTEDGRVKLLDFGIAKALSEEEGDRLTQTGMGVMTPAYASPEQVRGEAVTTSTDIYSLGVVLYELLAGMRPYDVAARNPVEAARAISQEEPAPPSTALGRTATKEEASTVETISRARSTEAGRLRRRLAGDLDVICLTALRKEPARRYASVEALAQDLRRHLEGLPVIARPDTAGYRFKKFVRRHRWGVFATTLVTALIVTMVGFYTVQLRAERDRARLESAKAAQVSAFLQELFAVSDPSESKGETVTARELLDEGAQRIEAELAGQPEVQAKMLDVVGNVYRGLGLYEKALPLLTRALDLRRRGLGPARAEVAESLNSVAELLRAMGLYAASAPLHREALAIRRRVHGADHPEVAESMNNLASLLRDTGDFEKADSLFRRALVVRRAVAGDTSEAVAETLGDLGFLLNEKGDYAAAERYYRQALDVNKRLFATDHPNVLSVMSNLTTVLYDQGRYAAAESLQREVLAYRRELYGEAHPRLATSLSTLGLILQDQGKLEEAEARYREALAMDRQLLGDDHPYVAADLGVLATLLYEKGDFDAAEPSYRESLALRRRVLGADHPDVGTSLNNLAFFLHARGDFSEAERYYREALALLRKTRGADHPYVANTLHNLARLRYDQGRYAEAESLQRQALAARRRALGGDHPHVARSLTHLGQVLARLGRDDEAERLLLEGYELAKATLGEANPQSIDACEQVISFYEERGRDGLRRDFQARLAQAKAAADR